MIERVTNADVGEIFYWCQGLSDFYKKSLMSGNTLEGVDHLKCPSDQFYVCVPDNIAQTLGTDVMFCNFRGECKRRPDGKNCMDATPEEAIKIVDIIEYYLYSLSFLIAQCLAYLGTCLGGALPASFCLSHLGN